ncbi:CsbD family protein [Methylobacterium gnaphalii]|uniref:CsbD-like domain-containing protein n=1 Tax=Methylobacterium gnaphalii TaxID=1010610 RepID=A0A512JMU1_9HYPH|nr:CsbD family protein [Methylobacterium gnaphalii]GEP11242.1 hypothetical protein MGN01_30870 [Methylobacterium gnaphalii]GJD70111.1 hypothetical protein MMMDOFMJ_3052 [Methylobacterium gnaphalii]GLS49746.1 hypothetical protein GCM10007885_25960 [Methylobacterium gnaphalii]
MANENEGPDPDRTEGSAKRVVGKVKEGIGNLVGDEKTKHEGKSEQVEGKVQNTIGSIKDTLKGK